MISALSFAQVKVTDGPMLENDRDSKMNRMIAGEEGYFYCYRIRTKGRGNSFTIEKYNSEKMTLVFSKEINVDDDDAYLIVDVVFANNTIYIFRRHYDKKADEMELLYQTVTADGVVSKNLTSLINVKADHYEFVTYIIALNTLRNKFMIGVSHKPNKESPYSTDLILYDTKNKMTQVWKKSLKKNLFNPEISFITMITGFGASNDIYLGMMVDEKDNLYYSVLEADKKNKSKDQSYNLIVGILEAGSDKPEVVNLDFDNDYTVADIEFSKTANNEIVVGGFLKDVVERKGRDLVNIGIFSYKVDIAGKNVTSKAVKIFTPKLLTDLESNPKRAANFKYKLDYIIPIGSDVYYIGEQYKEQYVPSNNYGGVSSVSNSSYWLYEYMDVIVAKLNAKGEFEWITNAPLRNEMRLGSPHVFKQYIAVTNGSSLYIFRNDHPKNLKLYDERSYDPRDLKSVIAIHGSSFIYSKISLQNGSITNDLVFDNKDYCFAPIQERNFKYMPPSECEIFVPVSGDEIILYTEDRGRDKFVKLKLQ